MKHGQMAVAGLVAIAMVPIPQEAGVRGGTTVRVVLERSAGRATYRYTVRNLGTTAISGVLIGVAAGIDEPELVSAPVGWRQTVDCAASMTAPVGWTGCVGTQEESERFFVRFSTSRQARELAPGDSLALAVTVARRDTSYESAVFWAIRSDGASDTGRVVRSPPRP